MSSDPKDSANTFGPEACWRVLEAATASSNLKRAARLREFLYYVGRKSIKEGCSDIHEQEIGQVVFGRRESYDTSQDNIVRVSATELRKRVDAFFASEGRDEPLIFEIPRGSYTPVFRLRAPEAPTAESNQESPHAADTIQSATAAAPRNSNLALLIVSSIAILLAIACIVLWLQNRSLRKSIRPAENQPALFIN